MPLDPKTLTDELSKFIDKESSLFDKFPSSKEDAADKWAKAFDAYAKGVFPLSNGMNQAAISDFKGNFMTIDDDTGMTQLAQCFVLYAVKLSDGMTIAVPTITGIPPAGAPNLSSVPGIGMAGGKSAQCIQTLVTIVDTWMKTGKAIDITTGIPVTIPAWL